MKQINRKSGYKCTKWSEEENKKLTLEYEQYSNEELGLMYDRSADGIRKQLNKLYLKRTKKSDIRILDAKAGKHNFFESLRKGKTQRKNIVSLEKKKDKKQQNIIKERKWAEEFIGKPIKSVSKNYDDETGKVWVQLDSKTRALVTAGQEEEFKEMYQRKQEEKLKNQILPNLNG